MFRLTGPLLRKCVRIYVRVCACRQDFLFFRALKPTRVHLLRYDHVIIIAPSCILIPVVGNSTTANAVVQTRACFVRRDEFRGAANRLEMKTNNDVMYVGRYHRWNNTCRGLHLLNDVRFVENILLFRNTTRASSGDFLSFYRSKSSKVRHEHRNCGQNNTGCICHCRSMDKIKSCVLINHASGFKSTRIFQLLCYNLLRKCQNLHTRGFSGKIYFIFGGQLNSIPILNKRL
jgi:hypothetical protein